MLVPFVVVAVRPQYWTWLEVLGFAAISLAFSKVVLPPNWLYDGAYGAVSYGVLQLVATLAAGALILLRWRAIERRDGPPPGPPHEGARPVVADPA